MNKRFEIYTELKNIIDAKNNINNEYTIYYNNYINLSELTTFKKPIIILYFDSETSERKTISFNNSVDERELILNVDCIVKSNNSDAYEILEKADNFIYNCLFENKVINRLNNKVDNIFYNNSNFDYDSSDNKINILTTTYRIIYNFKNTNI